MSSKRCPSGGMTQYGTGLRPQFIPDAENKVRCPGCGRTVQAFRHKRSVCGQFQLPQHNRP